LAASFDTPIAAVRAARRVAAIGLADAPRVAGAYGIVHRIDGQLIGTPVVMAYRALSAAFPGMIVVTDLFAQAAVIHDSSLMAEPIGLHDLPGLADPVALYALSDQ
jgi:class 3 adenylate cyclase